MKDVVSGKVRWAAAPPNFPQQQFDKWTYGDKGQEKLKKHDTLLDQVHLAPAPPANFFTPRLLAQQKEPADRLRKG
jgi:hypothetical protein